MLGMGKNTVEIIIAAKDRTSAAFAKVNTQMKTMKASSGRLGGAMNSLKGGFSKVTSSLGSFGAALGPVGIAAAAVGVALVTMGGAAIKAALDFEKASATIRVGTGATGEALAGLEESFKTVFTAVPTTSANAATAIADLNTRLGLTGEPLEALATQFLNLSRITGTDVSAAISSATRVMHDFAVSTEDQAQSLDYLFKVSQSTGIGITNLASNMTRYGGVMRQMGFDINESAALLGKFEKEGVNLELVLSSLRMGLANFARAGEEPVEALERVIAEIQGMGSAADRNLKAIEIFGARSGPDMAAAIYEGRFAIEELMATLDASGDTINKAAEDTLTFGDKWTLLKNNVLTAIEPIGDAILNVLGGAMEGAGKAFNVLRDAAAAVKTALEPVISKIEELRNKFKGGIDTAQLFSDIIIILKEGARLLSEKLIELLKKALTPLVDKLEDAIKMLTAFYDKLGPIKTLIEGTKDAFGKVIEKIHDVRESIEATKKPVEELEGAIKDVGEVAENAIEPVIKKTEEAIEKQKEFTVTIGDTTIEFKGMAAEVVKNADAYAKLEKSARTLIDLDWDTFIEFEAALPNINTGIGNMASSFVGFKDILEDNLDELENIKQSVMDIGEIAAPFLEKGFLEGLKGIGDFAGALKDANSAIKDFSSLQDISIDGCINFSIHVREMVRALEILEGQMEDLVPAFGNMDLLIDNIASSFLYGGDKADIFASSFEDTLDRSYQSLEDGEMNWQEFSRITNKALEEGKIRFWEIGDSTERWNTKTVNSVRDVTAAIAYGARASGEFRTELESWDVSNIDFAFDRTVKIMRDWARETYGVRLAYDEVYEIMKKPPEEQKKWLDDLMHSEEALTFQMDKQTNALKAQTEQLNKITEALQPYLEFMRTLNELATLSTVSLEDLNTGLKAINDTLINLSSALSTFDLGPVMKSLFAPETGTTLGFTKVMEEYLEDFELFATTLARVTEVIKNLSVVMGNAAGMVVISSKEMEEALALIPYQLVEIHKFLTGDLWGAIAASIAVVNSEWKVFEETLGGTGFTKVISTLSSLLNLMDSIKSTFEETSEQVVISSKAMEKALEIIPEQLMEITEFLRSDVWTDIAAKLSDVDTVWKIWGASIEETMPSFNLAMDTFSTLATKVLSLSSSLKELKDISVLSMTDIDEALKKIPDFLYDFVDALRLNMGNIKQELKVLHIEWEKHAEDMKETMPSYEGSADAIGKLIGSFLSLHSALKSLSEIGIITGSEFDRGFKTLMTSISNFAVSLSKNVEDLIYSLQKLRVVWVENEAVLFPLIRDFAIITDNLWGVAHNANRMAEEFNNLSKNAGTLEEGFKSLIEFINQVVDSTEEFYTPAAAAELAGFIEDVEGVIKSFVDLEIKLKGAMEKIKSAIGSAVNDIEGKIGSLANLVQSAYYSGANVMGAFISGIYSMSNALALAVQRQAAIVDAYLGAASPTKLGPLSHLDEWPRNLIQSYSAGIEAEMHTLNSSFSGMLASPVSISAGGGSRTVYLNVTQNISDIATADYANQSLERLLSRHNVM